ncbi:molybdopterin-dependent oxidoreductase [Chloroflexota bacterium]
MSPNSEGHEGEVTVYTSCLCDCGGNSQCVLKAHVKDGMVTRVEPDDRYNKGVGREDEVLSEQDLVKVRLQRRPCVKGLAFHKYIYHPERILYPLKRVPNTRRGEGKYVRISWEEALTTIADKMQEAREKYGPYSIIVTYPNDALARLFAFWGAGTNSWGFSSCDAQTLMGHIVAGVPLWGSHQRATGSAPDMLANTNLIVLWGFDPTMGHFGPAHQFAWFIKLCREKGKRVIIIDPRYSAAAEVMADQWMPIKPGTDHAMFLAMIYVLFEENLCDKDFVDKNVDPLGLERLKNYVMGSDDSVAKTPEWAEEECAVPAATIRELTRLIAATRPAWLWCNWSVTRKSRGEQTVQAFAALQALLGYWGIPGGGPFFTMGPRRNILVRGPLGPAGDYDVPSLYRAHAWAQAVLLLDKVRNGELSEEDYRRIVGWRAAPSLVRDFNPRMMFGRQPYDSDYLVTINDSPNYQVKALEKMDFVIAMHSIMNTTVKHADIILPAQDPMWEEKNITKSEYGGFECINYCAGVVKPPGEVKPSAWVYTKLAEKLGINPRKFFSYYTTDENWESDWERYLMDCYQNVIDYYKGRNIDVPSWEEFTHGKFINCDELDNKPFTGWYEQMEEGEPFRTESGKIEFYSSYLANEGSRGKGEHFDATGSLYHDLPGDWGDLAPAPVYRPAVRGMDDSLVKEYPLVLLSPHCRYRAHCLFWDHSWLKDHVYRHRVWINAADARARGIKDEDTIQVSNDRGTVVMPAYVTSRIMPGVVVIHHGGRYLPDSSGVDFGAAPSTLLGGDSVSCTTTAKVTTIVRVEKFKRE